MKNIEEKADIWKKFLTQCGARLTSQDVHWPVQLSMRVAPGPMTRASGLSQRTREKQHERNIKQAKLGYGPYAGGRPSALGPTERLVRSSRGAPKSSSSSWTLALRVDWLTLQAAAAWPKWQRSTTATR